MRHDLPSGTVTFLFTDVEGSTRLLHELGAEGYAEALAEHRRVIRDACAGQGGVEVDTQGDAFFFAFPTAPGALAAAETMTSELASGPIQVRVGLHTGAPLLTDEGYVGDDVHFAARVASSSHGGQVILSKRTAELVHRELTDLGEHRLKDIAEAVPIYQLGDGTFPPLKTISNTNLPRAASSFVGREAELAEVLACIEAGARLVTLSGPGGTGKTRLALEAAATLVPSYKAGVFWVGLASLRDPALVTETISQTLGAQDGLAEHVSEREMLLLLDNLEQVVESAPELSSLLSACPNLTLLVTSRELLRVQGEVEYQVPPLAEPEAVALFCERSQLEPSEETAELCARLDNLPLAVELAAARTKALSPKQILERLSQRLDLLKGGRDADPRQHTLRATVEWSYELLSKEEQQLFAHLSVFVGGCTFEAAEEVAEADLDTLQSLVEKSLLRFTNGRYWMLETIREFAGELSDSRYDGDRLRHRAWYRRLAAGLREDVESGDLEAIARLKAEHDNLRLALDSVLTDRDREAAADLVWSLWLFWMTQGFLREGYTWAQRAVPVDEPVSAGTVWGAIGASELARFSGDVRAAKALKYQAIEVLRDLGEDRWVAALLADLSGIEGIEGNFESARELGEESLSIRRALGWPGGVAHALAALAGVHFQAGNFREAQRTFEESRDLWEAGTMNWAGATFMVGQCARRLGDVKRARDAFRESYPVLAADASVVPELLQELGGLVLAEGNVTAAARLIGASDSLWDEVGSVRWDPADCTRTVASARTSLQAERFEEERAMGSSLSVAEAVGLALEYLD